jgi:hypothetical protein
MVRRVDTGVHVCGCVCVQAGKLGIGPATLAVVEQQPLTHMHEMPVKHALWFWQH